MLTGTLLLWSLVATGVWLAVLRGLQRVVSFPLPTVHAPRLLAFALALPNFLVALVIRDICVWHFGWLSIANVPLFEPYYLLNPVYMFLPASALAITPVLLWYGQGSLPLRVPSSGRGCQALASFCTLLQPVLASFFLEIILTEYIFALPGLGRLGIRAFRRRDIPLLQGFILCVGALYFLSQLLLDWGRRHQLTSDSPTTPPMSWPPPAVFRRGLYEGIVHVGLLLVLAVWAPKFLLYDPTEIRSANQFMQPGYRYVFGTDFLGRDVFSRTVEGFRNLMPNVVLITLCVSAFGLLGAQLSHKLPALLQRLGKYGADFFAAIPPFLVAFLAYVAVERHAWALEIALMLACLPGVLSLVTTRAPLHYQTARLIQLGELVLLLSVTFSFLNIVTESIAATWGGDIRLGMNYSHLNMWILLTPAFAVLWSRYSLLVLSTHISALMFSRFSPEHAAHAATDSTPGSPQRAALPRQLHEACGTARDRDHQRETGR
jgi:ABC-type dipeptide/oligopeptide/nickel transport system permease subunit